MRRARGIERALAISLLLFTGMRAKNLRQLRLDRSFRRAGHRVFVFLPAAETKTHADLELELPPETIALLDEFLAEHRRLLPCAEGPWLFSGMTGGPRSYSAMRDAVNLPASAGSGLVSSSCIIIWFFDVSNGIEEVSEGSCDQVDHGDEGCGVSVSASPCPGGLEEAVQALHAGVVMG